MFQKKEHVKTKENKAMKFRHATFKKIIIIIMTEGDLGSGKNRGKD